MPLTRIRRLQAALPLLGVLLISHCSNELAPTREATVTLQQGAPWPDTLGVAEIATVIADVVSQSGATISGVELEWSSSDSAIVQVTRPDTGAAPSDAERLNIGRRAIITTHGVGTATIIARLARPGFAPAELQVPVVVLQRSWPAQLTVSNEDTVAVGLADADLAVLGPLSFGWQSSDPSVLQATAVASDSSRAALTARASGPAQVTLTVTGPRLGRVEFREAFIVGNVQIIEQPAWPALLPITGTTQLAVAVMDAQGSPHPGMQVHWSSTNLSAFTVDSNGVVTAISRGGGEVVASVGAAPFQVVEHRAPLQVVQKWRAVSAGLDHTCAIASLDGTGYCWGSNNAGELGTGLTAAALPLSSRPLGVATAHRFNELQAGDAHTCGEEAQVNLFCWGSRAHGALGDGQCAFAAGSCGSFTASEIPVTIISDGNLDTTQLRIEQLLVGGTFTCILARVRVGFINRVRRLRCWGSHDVNDNLNGVSFDSTAAVAVPLAPSQFADQTTDFVNASAGGTHICAQPSILYLNFHLICMGMNFNGELGYGPLDAQSSDPIYHHPAGFTFPVGYSDTSGIAIGEGIPVSGLAAGSGHTCALDGVGGVLCWGNNSSGQLGAAGPPPGHSWPTQAAVPVTLVSLTAGGAHTCGLTAAGAAYCWGSNSNGQLGNGPIGAIGQPASPVSGGLTFASLSAGGSHTCGVTPNGSIYCWGANGSGQLGDGTQTDRGAPVRVTEAP